MHTVVSSASKQVTIGHDQPFVIIGERINPTGRKLFQERLRNDDLSTIVQLITKDQPTVAALTANGFSGLLNFLVIAFGGRAFLDVSQAPPPPGSRPPNPPFPASSATP